MQNKNSVKTEEAQAVNEEIAATADTVAESTGKKKKEKKKRSKKSIISTIINVVLIIAIIFAAVCTYISFAVTSGEGAPSIFGISFLSIQTDSMEPTLKPGDLIIDVAVDDPNELRPDDIITYWTVIDGEKVLNTHRIVNIYDGGDYLIFETQGDNNSTVDPLTVHQSEVVGKYVFRIGGIGKVFDYLQTSTGFLLVVLIPVFVFFIYHLVQFFRVFLEYQNVKNRIKYEQERGKTEDLIAAQQEENARAAADRAKLEAELREKLRAELLESMAKEQQQQKTVPETGVAEETVEKSVEEAVETAKENETTPDGD